MFRRSSKGVIEVQTLPLRRVWSACRPRLACARVARPVVVARPRMWLGLVAGAALVALALPVASLAAAPVNTGLPTVSGSAAQDATLSSSTGSWSNSPTSYSYQWQRCSSYSATTIADDPVGYWRLGESSGSTAYDASGYGNNGTYSNVTLGGPSAIGSSNGEVDTGTTYNGTSSKVTVSSSYSLNPRSALTVEGWIKPASSSGGGRCS